MEEPRAKTPVSEDAVISDVPFCGGAESERNPAVRILAGNNRRCAQLGLS
jgi:hypothetical protein